MAGEIRVKPLVPRYQLVGECESGHEVSLLEPEDRAERTGEEDSLNGCKRNQSLLERLVTVHPLHRPLGLLSDHGHISNGVEKEAFLVLILDVGVN